jgi:hypothetical protein
MPSRRRSDSQPRRRDSITEAIARRAYELFLERGSQHGHDLDDWLRAERELFDAMQAYKASRKPETDA